MSLYDELSVFKASYDLLLDIFQFTANFKREYKYTVREKLILTEQLYLSIEFWRVSGKSIKKPPANIV
jgi:hypothetical protein